ncbi:MAG: very short patch repair endonuclease [Candidatus Moranbacteria bacterium]|nr:very short patch repair endonuclease [Candidatus Moranbacteria bacterium]
MADIFSKEKRSEVMSKIRAKETKLEICLRKELWKEGFRYRKNAPGYYGKPDILLKKLKTVIFVDSCFWHGCPKHFKMPLSNKEFWSEKIERNRNRDKEVSKHYKKLGWKVLRIWEHDLKNDLNKTINKLISSIVVKS